MILTQNRGGRRRGCCGGRGRMLRAYDDRERDTWLGMLPAWVDSAGEPGEATSQGP